VPNNGANEPTAVEVLDVHRLLVLGVFAVPADRA
jgi:hypothetical protein